MLRQAGNAIDSGALQTRLAKALSNREAKAKVEVLKKIITETLRIDSTSLTENFTDLEPNELFLMGVAEVERIIDNAISELEPQVLAG